MRFFCKSNFLKMFFEKFEEFSSPFMFICMRGEKEDFELIKEYVYE